MMDCKKALVEADGDMDKAIEDLRKEFFESGQESGRSSQWLVGG